MPLSLRMASTQAKRTIPILFAAIVLIASSGCATYSDNMREAQLDVAAGQPEVALTKVDEMMDVDHEDQLPANLEDDKSLLLLERAILLQGLGQLKLSARDLVIADEKIDALDLSSDTGDDLAKWLYSDSATNYRAPAYERIMLNTLNMVNFMAMRDFQKAKVEARRFQVMESYYLDQDQADVVPELLALGNYMAGVAFEGARDYTQAVRYYSRAWHFGIRHDHFRGRLRALHQLTNYDGNELDPRASGLDAIRVAAKSRGPLTPEAYRKEWVDGDILVVVQSGLVPYKRAERIPIGLAITYATSHPRYFSADAQRRANELAVSGALKWVNFPQLTYEGIPNARPVSITLEGAAYAADVSTDVAAAIESGWDRIAGPLLAAALTRMLTRAVAGAATREVAKSAASSEGNGAASAIGILAQLIVEGTLTAMDKPDTRSWVLLPARVRIVRTRLLPGRRSATVKVGPFTERRNIDVKAGSINVVNFSKYR